jgi:hypothetical protein
VENGNIVALLAQLGVQLFRGLHRIGQLGYVAFILGGFYFWGDFAVDRIGAFFREWQHSRQVSHLVGESNESEASAVLSNDAKIAFPVSAGEHPLGTISLRNPGNGIGAIDKVITWEVSPDDSFDEPEIFAGKSGRNPQVLARIRPDPSSPSIILKETAYRDVWSDLRNFAIERRQNANAVTVYVAAEGRLTLNTPTQYPEFITIFMVERVEKEGVNVFTVFAFRYKPNTVGLSLKEVQTSLNFLDGSFDMFEPLERIFSPQELESWMCSKPSL